ncbi:MAG: hypothetical protein KIT43_03735 [Bauldia sp.]|nr:hypothetical protein [Bauldia sp.]
MSIAVRSENVTAARPVDPSAAAAVGTGARKPNPSKVRLAALMLVAVYPLITTLLYVILPLTEGWPTWARTLILAPLMVVSIVFFIAPRVQRHFGWFIARMPRPRP